MHSGFHNVKCRRLSSFCLELPYFFLQNVNLLAYCFILIHPFKLIRIQGVSRRFKLLLFVFGFLLFCFEMVLLCGLKLKW